jgi:hypothetical protein
MMRLLAMVSLFAVVGGAIGAPPFQVGETLVYRIFWGPVPIGNATLQVAAIESLDGHPCYHLVAEAHTAGVGRLLFPMDSRTESWLDIEGGFSRRFLQLRDEAGHQHQSDTRYDYDQHQAVISNLISGKKKTTPIDRPVQDVIAALYVMRLGPVALNQERRLTIHAGETVYDVHVQPDQRRQLSSRPVGDVNALRLEPQPTLRFVANNNGRLWFWITDDDRRIPLLATSTMAIGSAKIVLVKIESHPPAVSATPAVSAVSP